MERILMYAGVFLAALVISLILTGLCMKLAVLTGFMDVPKCEQHKQHGKATPLLGGIAMFTALFTVTGIGALILFYTGRFPEITGGLNLVIREITVVAICAAGMTLLGTWDDRHSMKAGKKFIGQLIFSLAAVLWGGASITLFVPYPVFSIAITVFWFLLICNAINFFDNMDGLAAGTAALAFLFFTIAAAVNRQYLIAVLGAACTGSAMGFWFWNRSPARIFMGDGGSLFLGFMIAYISTKVTYYTPGVSTTRFTILIPLFILAIPLLDTLTVVLIRIRNHKPVYIGDHNHISHRFWHMGMSRSQAVNMVHLLVLISGIGAIPLLWGDEQTCFLLILQGLLIYTMILFLQFTLQAGGEK